MIDMNFGTMKWSYRFKVGDDSLLKWLTLDSSSARQFYQDTLASLLELCQYVSKSSTVFRPSEVGANALVEASCCSVSIKRPIEFANYEKLRY